MVAMVELVLSAVFDIEALLTIVVALLALLFLPESIGEVWWLSAQEQQAVRLGRNCVPASDIKKRLFPNARLAIARKYNPNNTDE
eukprot:6219778-Amphidinium_carterae.1